MADIIDKIVFDEYMGLIKVDLSNYWISLNSNTYEEYKNMRAYLKGTDHKFRWNNTGTYLPSSVFVNPEVATLFKLKYAS